MALYECVFVTRADLSRKDIDTLIEEFSAVVTERKGKIIKSEYWGLRTLAYKINKSSKGHYFMIGIEACGDAIAEIVRQVGINENIVRNLNIKVDEIDDKPSAPLNKERDERDSRGSYDRAA